MENSVNLVNPEDISEYLCKFSRNTRNAELMQNYLALAIEKPLRKDKRYMTVLDALPDDAPDWLREKWGQGFFFRFIPHASLAGKVRHIYDWIEACLNNGEGWLEDKDSLGRPFKLLKFGAVDQAYKEAEKYSLIQRQKNAANTTFAEAFEEEIESKDIKIIKIYDDGYRLVQILSKNGAHREAHFMQNCMADGAYDEYFAGTCGAMKTWIYSLRDPFNKPHVTMEVTTPDNIMHQCAGKQNTPPKESYFDKIIEFIQENKISCSNFLEVAGYIFHEGEIYTLDNLPKGLELEGRVNITGAENFICPENLTIHGNLYLNADQKDLIKPCTKIHGRIFEYIQNEDNEKIKVIIHKGVLGKIAEENWCIRDPEDADLEMLYHREDGPAIINYDVRTKKVTAEKWFKKDKLHRSDGGPAVQTWDSITGRQMGRHWFSNGHRVDEDFFKDTA